MEKGKVVQQSDGSFGVTNNANVIGNQDDIYNWTLETSLDWEIKSPVTWIIAMSFMLDKVDFSSDSFITVI